MEEVGLVAGAAVGLVVAQAYTDLYNVVKDTVSQMVWCRKHCQGLKQDLDELQPIFDQICLPDLMCEEEKRSLERFKETLAEGRSQVRTCLELKGWAHPLERYRHSRELLRLRQKIHHHLQNLPLLSTLSLQHVNAATLHNLSKQLDKNREDVIGTLTSEVIPLADWVRQGGATDDERLGKHHQLVELSQEDAFLVGLDNPIDEVKSLLLSDKQEKMVIIMGGMGGIGKTTLAIAICNDPQVQEFFEDGIHFFTVSQSPDMKALLSSIWEKVVGTPVPLFQNEEDAYRQVKSKLLSMPPKGRLLVLDDVWSKANLEKLSFEVHGLKTMITSRQAPTLATHQSVTYNLGLLRNENAQSLFCYWAFGQDSIPSWVEDPLVVEEVISECKCLPLALKVIGASLSRVAEFPSAWRNARDKLREATPLDDHHEYALYGRLQTSIDALNPILRECFLDLAAYPEDTQFPVDTLLDIWMYVRGMAWEDAVFAFVELGSRCLLDFGSKVTSADVAHALECGSARALEFSQHDVMRDLALHLGRKDRPPSQRTRLLMPQKGKNIPTDWQSDHQPLAAQLITIRTGAMMKHDWPATLSFPYAEALLLDIGDCCEYHLPPFIHSMCRLKVLSIRGSDRTVSIKIKGSLKGLHQLQSIDCDFSVISLGSLGDVHKLEKLHLRNAGNADLAKLKNLRHLNLQGSSMLRELPASLEAVEYMDCRELKELAHNVGQLSALKELSLRNCWKLGNLPESLGNLSNLKTLGLFWCESLTHLPRTFGQLVALKKLDLIYCTSLQDLPENFGLLSHLEQLSLKGCTKLSCLPESFVQLSRLKRLDLSYCKNLEKLPERIGNVGVLRKLPESFGESSCLEHLSLEGCRELKHLPESFGQLSALRTLEMRGVGLEALPSSVMGGKGLVGLESVECSASLMPLWEEAVRHRRSLQYSSQKNPVTGVSLTAGRHSCCE